MHRAHLVAALTVLLALFGLSIVGPATSTAAPASAAARVDGAGVVGAALPKAATVTYRMVEKRERVPLSIRTVKTSRLPQGKRRVARWGHTGIRVVTYRVKFRDGEPVAARKVRVRTVRHPLARIVQVGTGVRQGGGGSSCSSHYRGACVPIASDVDCAGGSGNGPRYVDGPVYVVDHDIYGLDSDGDGVGCE